MPHPFFYTHAILPQEAVQEYYHRDLDALRARAIAAAQEVVSADPADVDLALARLHVASGLYDSAVNAGLACSLISDIINV